MTTLSDTQLESLAKWVSCNGEVWGVGPTAVFASAAALFLYHELESTIFVAGDHVHVSLLEKTLISTMILGMLALMVHIWVCSMRFFQYYLDTLIRDSPNMLLEMTTAGLLGSSGAAGEMAALGPLTRFLRQQQPQIHITVCWFLSLCYADYVRKNYCQRFNMPYLEEWQSELHERASRGLGLTMERVNSFVGAIHQRLRGYLQPTPQPSETHTAGAQHQELITSLVGRLARCRGEVAAHAAPVVTLAWARPQRLRAKSWQSDWSASPVRPPPTPSTNFAHISQLPDANAAPPQTPASAARASSLLRTPISLSAHYRPLYTKPLRLEEIPWCKPDWNYKPVEII